MKLTGGILVEVVETFDTQQCSECFHRNRIGNANIYSCSNRHCLLKAYRDESSWTTLKKSLIRLLGSRDKRLVVVDQVVDQVVVEGIVADGANKI